MHLNPINSIDFYKADHRSQYPDDTTEVYSNFTPRSNRLARIIPEGNDNKVVIFGIQYLVLSFLVEDWEVGFFNRDKDTIIAQYKRRMDNALGVDAIDVSHIEALHDLGYLPIKVKALPEGARVPAGVPVLTVVNTLPEFFWLTNYLESVMSCFLWHPMTTATTAYEYKRLLMKYAELTGADKGFIPFQAHDFSFRGQTSLQSAAVGSMGHLTSFFGTDTVIAIDTLEDYYHADSSNEMVGASVPATEHSVMCMGEKESEIDTFIRLISVVYPTGIISIVSDTWDFWKVITEYLVTLKDMIMSREGKVVIRPDSGDPVKIICGYSPHEYTKSITGEFQEYFGGSKVGKIISEAEVKGAVECMWDIFGGTITDEGYNVLDDHIGLIYGDSITLDRAEEILRRLADKGFASSNIVLGIGSYTYQHVTRDSHGFAMKATSGVVNGERRDIFKDPKTDNGVKKSAKGLLRVEIINGEYTLFDQQTEEQERQGELRTVFQNGQASSQETLSMIRERLEIM
jgi:nicotinamide phosphoribosyltransferase